MEVPSLQDYSVSTLTKQMRSLLADKRKLTRKVSILRDTYFFEKNMAEGERVNTQIRETKRALNKIERQIQNLRNDPYVAHFVQNNILPYDLFNHPIVIMTDDNFV